MSRWSQRHVTPPPAAPVLGAQHCFPHPLSSACSRKPKTPPLPERRRKKKTKDSYGHYLLMQTHTNNEYIHTPPPPHTHYHATGCSINWPLKNLTRKERTPHNLVIRNTPSFNTILHSRSYTMCETHQHIQHTRQLSCSRSRDSDN